MGRDIGPIGFIGGLNTKCGPFTQGKDQMVLSQNIHVIYGVLKKINGSSTINNSALNSGATITGLYDWQSVSQNRYLMTVAGTKIYSDLNLGNTPSDITGSATITVGNLHTFASLNNVLLICGGADAPLSWSGTGNVSSATGVPANGSLVVVANNIMFMAGDASAPSTLYWSAISDPTTWPAASSFPFRNADGDIITAIAPLNYNLVIFKRRSTGLLYTQSVTVSGGTTLGPLTQVNTSIGCAGPLAWDAMPSGELVVLGSDAHLRIFDGTNFEDISDPPPPASNIQPNFDAVNIKRIQYASVKVYPTLSQIWVAVSTGINTTNDSIFVYDYALGTWQGIIPDRAANVLCSSIDGRASPHHPIVMLSGDYTGFVYEHDFGTSNAQATGGNYTAFGQTCTPIGVESTDFQPKSIRYAMSSQSSGQIKIGWGFNDLIAISNTKTVNTTQSGFQLDINFFLDSSTLSSGGLIIGSVPTISKGRNYTVQVQFYNAVAGQPFSVHPFYFSEELVT